MTLSDQLALVGVIVTVIGVIVALIGIGVAVWQMFRANRIAQVQSWLTLRDLMANYDDVHANLRPAGKWHASLEEPHIVEEWAKVETYMGLFEYCKELIDAGLLRKDEFKRWYLYRLSNLLANPRIVTYKLHQRRGGWTDFIVQCEILEKEIPPSTKNLPSFVH